MYRYILVNSIDEYFLNKSKEIKEWNKAIKDYLNNLNIIEADSTNLKVNKKTRYIDVPKWMLYAASVHDDFFEFQRLISRHYNSLIPHQKRQKTISSNTVIETSSSLSFPNAYSTSSQSSSSSMI